MSNFHKFNYDCNAQVLADELLLNRHLWGVYPHRTNYPESAHQDITDIWIRYPEIDNATPIQVFNELECVNYQGFFELPSVRAEIFKVMQKVQGERLGRCMVTKLRPGGKIAPHIDEGDPVGYYDRFHVCIQADAASLFLCGNESATMRPGELWWFDNTQMHSVENHGDIDRIHLIMDIRIAR